MTRYAIISAGPNKEQKHHFLKLINQFTAILRVQQGTVLLKNLRKM